ncbi:MAG: C25 family cysteine peptidase [Pyrinomonadaceae bacterium]
MKKPISVFLLAILMFSTSASVVAQNAKSKSRDRAIKLRPINTVRTETGFSKTGATTNGSGVLVEWQMTAERDNLGFLVYRIDSGGIRQISPDVIMGSAARAGSQPLFGESYSFYDQSGDGGSVYYIETIGMNGRRFNSPSFSPKYVAILNSDQANLVQSSDIFQKVQNSRIASSELSVPAELQAEIDSNSVAADPVTHRWVISQPGVKIGVRGKGIYRVNRADLAANGFDAASDPAFWQLYVEGVQQAIIVAANGDYIEFYGKGIDTVESDTRIYYLVIGPSAGKRMHPRVIRPSIGTAVSASYEQKVILKERTGYISGILNGDAENYFGRAIVSTPTTYVFNAAGINFADTTTSLKIDFQGFSFVSHRVQITLNGNVIGTANGESRNSFSNTFSVPTSFLVEGANSLLMSAVGPSGDVSFFDKISIDFSRTYKAEQNKLAFVSPSSRIAKLHGFSFGNIRIFDLTYDSNATVLTNFSVVPDGNGFAVNLPAARPRMLYAVEDSAVMAVDSLSANDPGLLSVPSTTADLVIISYKLFLAEAETWAEYRRNQGFTVKVINVEDIYDEFNYGVLSADSIKSFLSYAASNWATPPRYALLIGDASYDSRNYQGLGFFNLVPTRMVDTIYTETGSDEALGDFDGDGLSGIAFGRIAARSSAEVTNSMTKTINFEQSLTPNSLSRGALFAYDFPDGYDFGGMSNRLAAQLPAGTPITYINRATPNAQTDIITEINSGKFIVNYSGHGTTGTWGGSNALFDIFDVPTLTNTNGQSIFTMLTCLNGYFMNANINNKSLAELLIDAPNSPTVAAWSSTGLTTADIQEIMATRFYSQLALGNITRMGDLVKDAKTAIPGGTDVRLSWALLGDPMLKVR